MYNFKIIQSYLQPKIYTYIHTYIHTIKQCFIQQIHTYIHIQLLASSSACWMISRQLIIVADSYIIYSRTPIHTCMYGCNYMNVWQAVYGGGGREGTGTGEAYLGLSLQVGSFVQEHLRHFHMTTQSGVEESSPTILSETDTHSERETPPDG